MEVAGWKEPLCPLIKPFGLFEALTLRAVAVAAGVEEEAEVVSAPGAAVTVPAERRRAAALDGPHDRSSTVGDAQSP